MDFLRGDQLKHPNLNIFLEIIPISKKQYKTDTKIILQII
jgi:hypothetical protein